MGCHVLVIFVTGQPNIAVVLNKISLLLFKCLLFVLLFVYIIVEQWRRKEDYITRELIGGGSPDILTLFLTILLLADTTHINTCCVLLLWLLYTTHINTCCVLLLWLLYTTHINTCCVLLLWLLYTTHTNACCVLLLWLLYTTHINACCVLLL